MPGRRATCCSPRAPASSTAGRCGCSTRTGRCPCPTSTACRSSGRTFAPPTSAPASPTRGRVELVYLADVDELAARTAAEPAGVRLRRSVGSNGTRLAAWRGEETVGFVEVDTNLEEPARQPRHAGWADVGTLWVAAGESLGELGAWLLGQAAAWLRLARADRLLDYATPDERERIALFEQAGFRLLTRTERGWERRPSRGRPAPGEAAPPRAAGQGS